jgi:hypothetical protein
MNQNDQSYCGIPFKFGGRDRAGLDCAGLARLWLSEQMGLHIDCPPSESGSAEKYVRGPFSEALLKRGDLIFLRERKSMEIRSVAVYLGDGKILHTLHGLDSRIENGLTLLKRVGFDPVGSLSPEQVALALADPNVAGPYGYVIYIVASLALTVASALLMKGPKPPQFKNQSGRYGFDALITKTSSELPLPDVLGKVALAGNSPYQTQIDKAQEITDATLQKVNKLVVFAAGPCEDIQFADIHINGIPYNSTAFFAGTVDGFEVNPAQTKAEAVSGIIGSDTQKPSLTIYKGDHDITVPVDIRAKYDRFMPVYGLSGSTYIIFRLIDSTRFQTFNCVVIVKGRKCRTFTSAGFDVTTVASESLSGADGSKVRFKLANSDIKEVTSLTVNGTSYSEISAATQTGNVYQLNGLKGFVEFITAPAAAATITIDYKYYPRAWTCNPAAHVAYLLTDVIFGLGKDESKIDWSAAVAARDYFDETVIWSNPDGTVTETRYCVSYAIDFAKSAQDHLMAVLDGCYSYFFISNGKYVIKPRKAESSLYSFNESNIAVESDGNSTFKSQLITRSQRANHIDVFYHSADQYNAEDGVPYDDPADQAARYANGNRGVVKDVVKLLGVDRKTQAQRYALTIGLESVNVKWTAEWTTNIKGIALEPGDVVDVTHSSQPTWAAKLFRVQRIDYDATDRLMIQAVEYYAGAYI